MPKPLTTAADYRKLLAGIREEMAHGLKKIEELLERQKVLSCWPSAARSASVLLMGELQFLNLLV